MKRYQSPIKLEEASPLYGLLNKQPYKQNVYKLISKLSEEIQYDINIARSVCLHLLEDVNDHEMMQKLDSLFSKSD